MFHVISVIILAFALQIPEVVYAQEDSNAKFTKVVQYALKKFGYDTDKEDDAFGIKTKKALLKFELHYQIARKSSKVLKKYNTGVEAVIAVSKACLSTEGEDKSFLDLSKQICYDFNSISSRNDISQIIGDRKRTDIIINGLTQCGYKIDDTLIKEIFLTVMKDRRIIQWDTAYTFISTDFLKKLKRPYDKTSTVCEFLKADASLKDERKESANMLPVIIMMQTDMDVLHKVAGYF